MRHWLVEINAAKGSRQLGRVTLGCAVALGAEAFWFLTKQPAFLVGDLNWAPV